MGDIILWLLSGHTNFEFKDYIVTVLFGFMGASVAVFAINPKITLPKRKGHIIEPGIVTIYVIGVCSAVAVGYKTPIPFIVGLISPTLVPLLLKNIPVVFRVVKPLLIGTLETAIKLANKGGDDSK